MPAEPSAAVVMESGPLRRDPRSSRRGASPGRPATQEAVKEAPKTVTRIADPAYYVLVVPDFEVGVLTAHDRDILGAARILADSGGGAVMALAVAPAAEEFASAGADRIVIADWSDSFDPEQRLANVIAAISAFGPKHLIFPDTLVGSDLGRRVAAYLGELPATQVVRVSGREVASRIDGGLTDLLLPAPRVIFLAADVVDPPSGKQWEARVVPLSLPTLVLSRVSDCGIVRADPAEVPISQAELIVSAGDGVTDWEAFHDVARALGASEAGSRVVVDAGHLPRSRQVGASGVLVEPRCYVAFGIAGAVQHLQGIVRCERVIAVNTDLRAEMVKRADLSIIADAQEVMPALSRLTREKRLHRDV